MPKVDPITGCKVMTNAEFIAAQAKRAGVSPEQAYDDTFGEMYRLMEKDRQDKIAFIGKHENALDILVKAVKEYDTEPVEDDPNIDDPEKYLPPMPMRVLRITDADVSISMRSGFERIDADVLCWNLEIYSFTWINYWDHGSRMEPPDGGVELNWQIIHLPYNLHRLIRYIKTLVKKNRTKFSIGAIRRSIYWKINKVFRG